MNPKTKVPKAASRIISFLASAIGIRLLVFSSISSEISVTGSVVDSAVVDSVVVFFGVTSLVEVNISVLAKKFIFLI